MTSAILSGTSWKETCLETVLGRVVGTRVGAWGRHLGESEEREAECDERGAEKVGDSGPWGLSQVRGRGLRSRAEEEESLGWGLALLLGRRGGLGRDGGFAELGGTVVEAGLGVWEQRGRDRGRLRPWRVCREAEDRV